jgi:hypothetical protein
MTGTEAAEAHCCRMAWVHNMTAVVGQHRRHCDVLEEANESDDVRLDTEDTLQELEDAADDLAVAVRASEVEHSVNGKAVDPFRGLSETGGTQKWIL